MYIWISLSPKIHISKKGMKQLGKGVVPLPLPHLPGLLVQKFFRWPPTCAHDLGIWGLWRSLNWKGKTKIAGWLSGHVWAKFQFWSEEDDLCLISWYRSWFQHTLSNLYIFVVELTTKESIYIYTLKIEQKWMSWRQDRVRFFFQPDDIGLVVHQWIPNCTLWQNLKHQTLSHADLALFIPNALEPKAVLAGMIQMHDSAWSVDPDIWK